MTTAGDALWRDLVKERDLYTCQRCGTRYVPGSVDLHAHHVFTKSRQNTRHMLSNGVALCAGCHGWVHANPWDAEPWLRSIVPDFDDLQLESRRLMKREVIAGNTPS